MTAQGGRPVSQELRPCACGCRWQCWPVPLRAWRAYHRRVRRSIPWTRRLGVPTTDSHKIVGV